MLLNKAVAQPKPGGSYFDVAPPSNRRHHFSAPARIASAVAELWPHNAWFPQITVKAVEVLLSQQEVDAPHNTD
jgi:hypothetical protein